MISVTEAPDIPYERQADSQTGRTCGATCLSMVYRSLGKEVTQAEIWPAIAKENRFGRVSSTTHLMTRDALSRGFAAMAFQTRHPLHTLRLCRESGIRAILNHRLTDDAPTGHYTVLVDIDDRSVVLHDPYFGPARRLSHADLLELWQPLLPGSEIIGNVLIGVVAEPRVIRACDLCRSPIPSNVECPRCRRLVGLQPGALLGCLNSACIARMWNYICCPSCDYTWALSLEELPFAATASSFLNNPDRTRAAGLSSLDAQAAKDSEESSSWMKLCFGELDKFCNHILSLPALANHAAIKQQLESITASKEAIKLAESERLVYQKIARDQMAKLQEETELKREAHRRKLEELNRTSPPLDGKALGRALLKNLGFIE
jgi:hypothetical protein